MKKFDFDKKKVLSEGSIGSFTEPFFDYKVMPLNHCLEQKVKKRNINSSTYEIHAGNFVGGCPFDSEEEYTGVVQKFIRDEYNDIKKVVILSREKGEFMELDPETVHLAMAFPKPIVDKSKLDMGNTDIHNFMTNESINQNVNMADSDKMADDADKSVLDLSWEDFKEQLQKGFWDNISTNSASSNPKIKEVGEKSVYIYNCNLCGFKMMNFIYQIEIFPLDGNRLEIQVRCGKDNNHSVYHIFYNEKRGYYMNTEIGRMTLFEESCPCTLNTIELILYIVDRVIGYNYTMPKSKPECVSITKGLLNTWNINHGIRHRLH